MIDVNLTGVWHTAKAAIQVLIEQGTGGSIIITSSLAGLKAGPGASGYKQLLAATRTLTLTRLCPSAISEAGRRRL